MGKSCDNCTRKTHPGEYCIGLYGCHPSSKNFNGWNPDYATLKHALEHAVKDLEVARGLLPEHHDIKETVDYYIDKAVG